MATSKFIRFIRDNSGYARSGLLVYLVPAGESFNTNLPLTEHTTRAGYYSRAAVVDGEYDIYINSGSGAALYETAVWHGEKAVSTFIAAVNADNTTFDVSITKHGLVPKAPNDPTKFLDGIGVFDTVKDADLSTSDVTTNNVDTTKHGFVPKAPNDSTQFLDGTGAFDTVKDTDLSMSDVTTNNVSTTKHGLTPKLPNDATQFLDGSGAFDTVKDTDLSTSDNTTNNVSTTKHGFTPKLPNDATKFLDGAGAFDTVKDSDLALSDVTTNDVSTTKHGFVPKLPNDASKFLNGAGAFAVPAGGGSSAPPLLFPLRSTINNAAIVLTDTAYSHFGILCVNPINGKMAIIERRGTTHINNNAVIDIRKSTNGGKTWTTPTTIFSAADYDLRNCGGGYTQAGRLIIFYGKYYQATTWAYIAFRYSDDDGTTWSNETSLNTESNTAFSPFGKLIEDENGYLYQTWYGINSGTYTVYVAKSTNNGVSWTNKVVYTGASAFTESSLVYIGGGRFIVVSRQENGNYFNQCVSDNYCESWTNQGATNFDTWTPNDSSDVPMPHLAYIDYEGVGIVALYYTFRAASPQKLKVVFGLATTVFGSATGWVAGTIKDVYTHSTSPLRRPGYQSFFHPQNKFKGIGITYEEPSNVLAYPVVIFTPPTGLSGILTSLGL